MKVLDSRVLVQVDKKGYTQKIGEFEVTVGAGEYEVAKVVAVGPKVEGEIHEGDTVYLYTGAGKEITVDGGKFRVITSSEVIVVL